MQGGGRVATEAGTNWAERLIADPLAGIAIRGAAAQACVVDLATRALAATSVDELVDAAPAVIAEGAGAAGCSLRVRFGDHVLERSTPAPGDAGAHGDGEDPVVVRSTPIVVGSVLAGELEIADPAAAVAASGAVDAFAAVLGAGIDAARRAEALTVQAASTEALAFVATVYGRPDAAMAARIGDVLARFPGVADARVAIDERGGPAPDLGSGGEDVAVRIGAGPVLDVSVRFDDGFARRAGSAAAVRRVLAALATVLSREAQLAELREEVDTDPLTGVGNRRRALRALRIALSRADRVGDVVSVLLLDLDRFSEVNAEQGHPGADRVLRRFAEVLTAETRAYDTVGRFGGDEFMVVLPGTGSAEALRMAERLRHRTDGLARPGTPITVSVGVATFPRNGNDVDPLLAAADRALYDAKAAGRNQVALARE